MYNYLYNKMTIYLGDGDCKVYSDTFTGKATYILFGKKYPNIVNVKPLNDHFDYGETYCWYRPVEYEITYYGELDFDRKTGKLLPPSKPIPIKPKKKIIKTTITITHEIDYR